MANEFIQIAKDIANELHESGDGTRFECAFRSMLNSAANKGNAKAFEATSRILFDHNVTEEKAAQVVATYGFQMTLPFAKDDLQGGKEDE
jgi:hypothetical protein